MKTIERPIEFIPVCYLKRHRYSNLMTQRFQASHKKMPPTRLVGQENGLDIYSWYTTEDEYLRLNKLFGREFQEVNLGGTYVVGKPSPCIGCGKYTEFIDWSAQLLPFRLPIAILSLLIGFGLHSTVLCIRPISCLWP
jgi:hypothetical protein